MANRYFTQFFYTPHKMPVLIDCNFIVDSTNGNGLGIRSLKGQGVSNVFMHTSATPAPGNPNPASGVILVQLTDNYTRYFGGFSGQVSPVGSSSNSITSNTAYVITSLGTTTVAQWVAAGVPVGITPAVGVAFIAIETGAIGGTGTAAPTAAAGSAIDHIEVLGDPNTTLGPVGYNNTLPYIVLQCFEAGAVAAPANGSGVGLSFYLSNSSVMIDGE
jgi:hypothetical protein